MLAVLLSAAITFGPVFPTIARADGAATTTSDRASTDARLSERSADITPPVISPHDNVWADAVSADGALVSYLAPATLDDVDGAGTASCTPPPGSTFAIGTTTVTCTATDAAGNSAEPTSFSVIVRGLPEPAATTTATTTIPADTTATTTATTTASGTAADPVGNTGTPPATAPNTGSSASSTSSTSSGIVAPAESNTDNTDFRNITNGPPPPGANDPRPVLDASATTTEAVAPKPLFAVATSTDGTGSKIGGMIFTGSAAASTTVKNILNITRSNVDGAGVSNSSRITANTDNVGEITTADDTRAFTGDNSALGGVGDAAIHTGAAASSARVLNVVNTNFFNSNGLVLFLNPQNAGGLDLRSANLSYLVNGGVGASPTQLGCTILTCLNSSSLMVLNKNEGTVHNDVLVRASTGGNTATSTKEGGIDIRTGNAYASAAVLNLVNTNFINSKYFIASFDNFGTMQGDVVLPDASFFSSFFKYGNTLPDLNSSSYIVSNDNNETFMGTTTAQATTGGNMATTTPVGLGHGEVSAGQAHTSATSYTAANQTYVGGSSARFVFHVSGAWSGTVKGLPAGMSWRRTEYGVEVYSNGRAISPLGPQGVYNSANFVASSTNKATVNTNVNVVAETGDNNALTEDGVSSVGTGDAYSTANVVNMVNTNVVNRNFMFAVFNIAGDWDGDITFGGHSPNLKVTTTVDAASPVAPGSDITYHFNVANTGDVSAENVTLSTAYDGGLLFFSRSSAPNTRTATGTDWNLGSIAAGASVDVTAIAHVSAPGLTSGFTMSLPITATVTSSTRDQDMSDNTQRTTITVALPASSDSTGGTDGSRDRGTRDGGTSGGDTTGGGATPAPTGGGGNTGGGNPPANSGSTGGNNTSGSNPPATSNGASNNTGGGNQSANGGGGGGAITGAPSNSNFVSGIYSLPTIRIKKTTGIASTTAPATVAYKVLVTNDKQSGPLFKGVLTDTLYGPSGAVMSSRSWDLDTVYEGDGISLTYDAEFTKGIPPGLYKNIARVTGITGNPYSAAAAALNPVEGSVTIMVSSSGSSPGTATSTVAISGASLTVSPGARCAPLLAGDLKMGGAQSSADVLKLQKFLNTQGARIPETGFFGPLTAAAVSAFQRKYARELLTPLGLSSPTGSVDAATRQKINTLACAAAAPTARQAVSSKAPSLAKKPAAKNKKQTKPPLQLASPAGVTANSINSFFKPFFR